MKMVLASLIMFLIMVLKVLGVSTVPSCGFGYFDALVLVSIGLYFYYFYQWRKREGGGIYEKRK